jgi:nucleotide-binding universal stress UspA family protein
MANSSLVVCGTPLASMVVRGMTSMIELKRILVPHDFGETSVAASRYAASLARSFGAQVAFLNVVDNALADLGETAAFDAEGAVTAEAREGVLRSLTPADRALNPEFFVRAGTPAVEIVRFAREHDIDLIVMGTHGRGLVGHMVMGSVAEKVVRTAPCPVLTVRNTQSAQGAEVVADVPHAAAATM